MMNYPTEDLTIDIKHGIAYQVDRTCPIDYNDEYFDKVENKTSKKTLSELRTAIVRQHSDGLVLDVGCGDGTFLKTAGGVGYDIMPKTVKWLKDNNMFYDISQGIGSEIDAVTCFDSLEHMPEPKEFLCKIDKQILVVSMPVIPDIRFIRQWKHYRPDEHFWYWTNNGFIEWMDKQGFQCIDHSDAEVLAGRQDVGIFVFRRP